MRPFRNWHIAAYLTLSPEIKVRINSEQQIDECDFSKVEIINLTQYSVGLIPSSTIRRWNCQNSSELRAKKKYNYNVNSNNNNRMALLMKAKEPIPNGAIHSAEFRLLNPETETWLLSGYISELAIAMSIDDRNSFDRHHKKKFGVTTHTLIDQYVKYCS
ncbi:MAG: hypothetical protein KAI99_04310 [Cyclobacteriaceae bacterium]|nr:hypothetical protein [Cyclobacteriaceae bacterium]